MQGGYIACSALAEKLGKGAKIYIQNVRPGISTTDQREEGCKNAAADRGLEVVRVDYNENERQQGAAADVRRLAGEPGHRRDLRDQHVRRVGCWFGHRKRRIGGAVQVALFDASEENIGYLRDGTVSLVIAQKPADMGYLGVIGQMANVRGVTSMPEARPHRLLRLHGGKRGRSGECEVHLQRQLTRTITNEFARGRSYGLPRARSTFIVQCALQPL